MLCWSRENICRSLWYTPNILWKFAGVWILGLLRLERKPHWVKPLHFLSPNMSETIFYLKISGLIKPFQGFWFEIRYKFIWITTVFPQLAIPSSVDDNYVISFPLVCFNLQIHWLIQDTLFPFCQTKLCLLYFPHSHVFQHLFDRRDVNLLSWKLKYNVGFFRSANHHHIKTFTPFMMTKNSKEINYNKIFKHQTLNRRKMSQLKQTCNNQRFAFFCRAEKLMQLHLLRHFKFTNSVSYSIGSLLSAFSPVQTCVQFLLFASSVTIWYWNSMHQII